MKHDPLIGTLVAGRFQVEAQLGRGGMGIVYRAIQMSVGRPVALKVLPADLTAYDVRVERFEREARITANLRSPHTVTVHDFGTLEDGSLFIAMELLEGRSLQSVIDSEAPLHPHRVSTIADQLCISLEEAHAKGLVHRDLKPANVMIEMRSPDVELAKVLDFGIAKMLEGGGPAITKAGTIFGTPQFMSPEQCQGWVDQVTARSDLYALGVIMYFMLTGKLPFEEENVVALLLMHVNQAPPPLARYLKDSPAVRAFQAVIDRCLAKDPAARYASAGEVRADLRSKLGPIDLLPRHPGAAATVEAAVEEKERRRAVPMSALGGAALLLAAAAVALAMRAEPKSGARSESTPDARVQAAVGEYAKTASAAVATEKAPKPVKLVPVKPRRLVVKDVVPASSRDEVTRAVEKLAPKLTRCGSDAHVYVTLAGDGRVLAVSLRPENKTARACVEPVLRASAFPPSGAAFQTFELTLGE